MKQTQLAEKCATTKAYLSKVENNVKNVCISTPKILLNMV